MSLVDNADYIKQTFTQKILGATIWPLLDFYYGIISNVFYFTSFAAYSPMAL